MLPKIPWRRPSTDARREAIGWLRDNAVAVNGGANSSLVQIIGDARLVALGESTHGSHEHHALRTGITKALFEYSGFRTLFLEANWVEVRTLNRYVSGDSDVDPAVALRSLNSWPIVTEDTLEMAQWMKHFNAAREAPDRVRVVGMDIQSACGAMHALLSFVGDLDEQIHAEVLARYALLHRVVAQTELLECGRDCQMNVDSVRRYGRLGRSRKSQIDRDADEVLDILRSERVQTLIAAGGDDQIRVEPGESYTAAEVVASFSRVMAATARMLGPRYILIPRQLVAAAWDRLTALAGRQPFTRDAAMAQMVQRDLEARGPNGGGAVIWAHNGHVRIRRDTVGMALREAFGSKAIAVLLVFGSGQFRARAMGSGWPNLGELTQHQLEPPLPDSYEAAFGEVRRRCFAVDLRALPEGSEAAAWFSERHSLRSVGAAYAAEYERQLAVPTRLAREANIVIYVAESTPARLLPDTADGQ